MRSQRNKANTRANSGSTRNAYSDDSYYYYDKPQHHARGKMKPTGAADGLGYGGSSNSNKKLKLDVPGQQDRQPPPPAQPPQTLFSPTVTRARAAASSAPQAQAQLQLQSLRRGNVAAMNNLLKLRSLAAPQPTTGGGGNNPSGANAHASASTKRGAVPAPPHRLPLQVPAPTSGKRLRHSERRRQQNREASARFRERGKQRQSELAELQQDIQKVKCSISHMEDEIQKHEEDIRQQHSEVLARQAERRAWESRLCRIEQCLNEMRLLIQSVDICQTEEICDLNYYHACSEAKIQEILAGDKQFAMSWRPPPKRSGQRRFGEGHENSNTTPHRQSGSCKEEDNISAHSSKEENKPTRMQSHIQTEQQATGSAEQVEEEKQSKSDAWEDKVNSTVAGSESKPAGLDAADNNHDAGLGDQSADEVDNTKQTLGWAKTLRVFLELTPEQLRALTVIEARAAADLVEVVACSIHANDTKHVDASRKGKLQPPLQAVAKQDDEQQPPLPTQQDVEGEGATGEHEAVTAIQTARNFVNNCKQGMELVKHTHKFSQAVTGGGSGGAGGAGGGSMESYYYKYYSLHDSVATSCGEHDQPFADSPSDRSTLALNWKLLKDTLDLLAVAAEAPASARFTSLTQRERRVQSFHIKSQAIKGWFKILTPLQQVKFCCFIGNGVSLARLSQRQRLVRSAVNLLPPLAVVLLMLNDVPSDRVVDFIEASEQKAYEEEVSLISSATQVTDAQEMAEYCIASYVQRNSLGSGFPPLDGMPKPVALIAAEARHAHEHAQAQAQAAAAAVVQQQLLQEEGAAAAGAGPSSRSGKAIPTTVATPPPSASSPKASGASKNAAQGWTQSFAAKFSSSLGAWSHLLSHETGQDFMGGTLALRAERRLLIKLH